MNHLLVNVCHQKVDARLNGLPDQRDKGRLCTRCIGAAALRQGE